MQDYHWLAEPRVLALTTSLFAMKHQHGELGGQLPRTLRPTIM